MARVAGCVTRQRISFRFFKQWYWGMFDEEIQACAHRAMSSLGSPAVQSTSLAQMRMTW